MKWLVSLLFVLTVKGSFSQTVSVTGRSYYDVNRNHIYDGGDSALRNVYVNAHYFGGTYSTLANSAG
jgi:hypothetical protein